MKQIPVSPGNCPGLAVFPAQPGNMAASLPRSGLMDSWPGHPDPGALQGLSPESFSAGSVGEVNIAY